MGQQSRGSGITFGGLIKIQFGTLVSSLGPRLAIITTNEKCLFDYRIDINPTFSVSIGLKYVIVHFDSSLITDLYRFLKALI